MAKKYKGKYGATRDPKPVYVLILLGVLLISVSIAAYFAFHRWQLRAASNEVRRTSEHTLRQYEAAPEFTQALAPLEAQESQKPELIIRPEFLQLRETFDNDDIVGHLRIEGTGIDYIVVQASDNVFYLDRDIHGQPSAAGWIFLDYEVDITGNDQNTVIYGHNMITDIMFHSLRYYADYEFFRQHPVVTFNTLYEDMQWEIFAFYEAHIDFPYTLINYESEAQWEIMLRHFIESSIYDTGIVPETGDRILTLSTCTNVDDDMRLVLQARLVRQD